MHTETCHDCGATVPVDLGYSAWCERCGWNIVPASMRESGPPSLRRRAYETAARRLGDRLERAVSGQRPRTLTVTRVLLYLLAAFVHFVTVIFLALGVLIIGRAVTGGGFATFVVGLLLLLVGWALRPRFDPPPDGVVISRDEAPALHQLVADVAAVVGTTPPSVIVATPQFEAAVGRLGPRQRRAMVLGMPLAEILDGRELVALLGHELGHDVGRDPARAVFIVTAVHTVFGWYEMLAPSDDGRPGALGVIELPARLLMAGLAQGVWLLVLGFVFLHHRDSQLAEHVADSAAARAAGTDATASTLEKLVLAGLFAGQVSGLAIRPRDDFFATWRASVAALPNRERERLARLARTPDLRLVASHPSIDARIRVLLARPRVMPSVRVDAERLARIRAELEPFEPRLARELADSAALAIGG